MRFIPWVLAATAALAPGSMLTAAETAAELKLFSGSPFGVGVVRVARAKVDRQPTDVTYHVEAAEGQVFYPAYFRESLPGAVDPDEVAARGAYFLFKGDGPTKVRFSDGSTTTDAEASAASDDEGRQQLLERWWAQYQLAASRNGALPVVENYTTLMLARRLGLKTPKPALMLARRVDLNTPEPATRQSGNENEMLGAFLGFEELRLAMQADRMLDDGDLPEPADWPLSVATLPPSIVVPEVDEVDIEPLAGRVPEECFYIRFGSYSNYRWFRDTMNTWGGNLREIVATRSLDYDISGRLERQLVLKDSDLGKFLGDAAISDMAVIGTDTFVREGASIGILFREKQPGILSAAILAQRAAAAANGDVTEQKLEMEGKQVSLLTAPGNVVRSYYVADGQLHFITTSSTLVRRFIETGKGVRPLAELKEFRYARTRHAVGKGNPILAYLSDPFIRQLVSPAYRVEMTRRMKAEADVELVALARLAAKAEAAPHGSVEELVAGEFLPAKFGKRADDSIPLVIGDKVADSLRGARRSFLPVADVVVAGMTKSEAEAYGRFSQAYQALYGRMDPVSISLAREPAGPNQERIVLDLSITPFTRQNLGSLANWLSPASHQQVSTGPEVLALVEVGTRSRLFAGVVDQAIPYRIQNGRVAIDETVQERPPVFMGEHGRAFRQMIAPTGEKTADGYFSKSDAASSEKNGRFGLNDGREWGDWYTIAMSTDTLRSVTPNLAVKDGSRPAQLRLTIGNLGESKAAPMFRAQQYLLEREASRVNAKLLDSFTEQFKVQDKDAPETAFSVLGARVVCPLGGEYRREPPDYQFSTHQPWYSSAWPVAKEMWTRRPFYERLSQSHLHEPPASYSPRMLSWVKGLGVEVQFDDQTMLSRIELVVAREP